MIANRRMLFGAAASLAAGLAPRNSRAEALPGFGRALALTLPPAPPPAFVFLLADGAPKRLADYAGQGVVLNLWATWCVPCVAEMPALDALARAVVGEKIVVLPLSSDREGAKRVDAFYFTHGIRDLPILLDPKGEAARGFGVRGIPTTVLINRSGMEVGRVEGAVDWSDPAAVASVRRLMG